MRFSAAYGSQSYVNQREYYKTTYSFSFGLRWQPPGEG
jgi:hypothetical protein